MTPAAALDAIRAAPRIAVNPGEVCTEPHTLADSIERRLGHPATRDAARRHLARFSAALGLTLDPDPDA